MKRLAVYILVPAAVLLGCFCYLLAAGEAEASAVREQVVRFHVVGADNSEKAQGLKIKVRDGIFDLVEQLFGGCRTQEEALEAAEENRGLLEEAAEQILRENGCFDGVEIRVGERFFPTKTYGALSFPAGRYQALSVCIGEARGENFWCVLYPALCLSPAVAEEDCRQEMLAVVGEEGTSFLQKNDAGQRIKFALVEWFEQLMEKLRK